MLFVEMRSNYDHSFTTGFKPPPPPPSRRKGYSPLFQEPPLPKKKIDNNPPLFR